jgi:TetR/AcrR family transcriptional regulator
VPRTRVDATRTRKAAHRPRDAEATRGALLERATVEFAERGYDGARIDEIALQAGINKRMIYAYFGDKDGLYRAVLDACLTQALELGREGEVPEGATLRHRAEAIIRRFFGYLALHPDFVQLLGWETLARDRRGRSILLARLEAGLEPLRAIVRRGVRAGEFRADLEPRAVVLAVNAMLIGYFTQRHLVEALWKTSLDSPAAGEAVLRQFLHILLDGIGA